MPAGRTLSRKEMGGGGSTATLDADLDEIGEAMGMAYADGEVLVMLGV